MEGCTQSWCPTILQRLPNTTEIWISWKKPPGGFLKVNVDGACDPRSVIIGAGGIVRDHDGKWMVGFIHNIGKGHPLLAEAWAILTGIQIAADKGYSSVIIESDCLELVQLFERPLNLPMGLGLHNIVRESKTLPTSLPTSKVVHCHREGNSCADHLAKMALTSRLGVHMLQVPPATPQGLLVNDYCGAVVERVPFHLLD